MISLTPFGWVLVIIIGLGLVWKILDRTLAHRERMKQIEVEAFYYDKRFGDHPPPMPLPKVEE